MYPNNPGSNMAYLNSISPSQPVTPAAAPTPAKPKSASRVKRIVIFSILGLLFIGLGVAIAFAAQNGWSASEEEKKVEDDGSISAEEYKQQETLNQTLADKVKTNPHKDYEPKNKYSFNYGATPDEIITDYNLKIKDLDLSDATVIPAMNSNILNYYLDQDNVIVVITDEKEMSFQEKKSKTLIVYASRPEECDYLTFIPEDFTEDGLKNSDWYFHEQMIIYLSRSELFNQLTENAKFYVIRK